MTDTVTAAALASEDGTDAVPTEISWELVALGLLRCFQRNAEIAKEGKAGLQLIFRVSDPYCRVCRKTVFPFRGQCSFNMVW
jgi:hypothetical protein